MKPIIMFSIFTFNLHIQDRSLYVAYCTNGFGHGFGNTLEDAQQVCIGRIVEMVELYNEINMGSSLLTKEQFIEMTDPMVYGLDRDKGWNTPEIQWLEIKYSDLLPKTLRG